MSRIFVTGDKHGDYNDIVEFTQKHQTTINDVMIVLGDHGTLYYGRDNHRDRDRKVKKLLASLPITFIMIRGNHDRRPEGDLIFIQTKTHTGWFYIDNDYPNILYTDEFAHYGFGTHDAFVIGGAYSVDKWYRLEMYDQGFHQYKWFADEQLTDTERNIAYTLATAWDTPVTIMSHTCPLKYLPTEMKIPITDGHEVDNTMEEWLDTIEENIPYDKWYCGHFHTDKTIDKMRFMYNDVILFDEVP